MAPLDGGPCAAWVPADCQDWPDNLLPVRDMALMAATEILWARTRRRFGLCELNLRPCKQECWPANAMAWLYGSWLPTYGGSSFGWPYPALLGGRWLNMGCGQCGDSCSCTVLHEIQLPYPVAEIIEVKVDGQVLVTGAYRIDDWRYLVRIDGGDWPSCNDLNEADTEIGTWSVTASIGEQVPVMGQFAVNDLALQIAKGCIGAGDCNLPVSTLKSMTRLGVSQDFVQGSWLAGYTSLPSVNLFLETWNPTRSGASSIFDIDGGGARGRIVGT